MHDGCEGGFVSTAREAARVSLWWPEPPFLLAQKSAAGTGGRKRQELLVFFLHLPGVWGCSVVSAAEFSLTQGHTKRCLLHFAASLTDIG